MRLLIRCFAVLGPLAIGGAVFAQRNAGTFEPENTLVGSLNFAPNPDGGAPCVSAQGVVNTDLGVSEGAASPITCPRNASQATKVNACAAIAVGLVNAAARIADGGI